MNGSSIVQSLFKHSCSIHDVGWCIMGNVTLSFRRWSTEPQPSSIPYLWVSTFCPSFHPLIFISASPLSPAEYISLFPRSAVGCGLWCVCNLYSFLHFSLSAVTACSCDKEKASYPQDYTKLSLMLRINEMLL